MQKKSPLQTISNLTAAVFLLFIGQGCVVEDGSFETPVAKQKQMTSEPSSALSLEPVVPTFTPTPEALSVLEPTNPPGATDRPLPSVRVNANLRAGPGTDYPILGGRPRGAVLKIVGRTADGTWLLLEKVNWIFTSLVNDVPPDLPVAENIPPIPTTEVPNPAANPTLVPTAVPKSAERPQSTEPTPIRARSTRAVANEDQVTGRIKYASLAASDSHMCAVSTEGTLQCWGDNLSGQMRVPLDHFSAVAVGQYRTCGLRANGLVSCWGANSLGEADAPFGQFSAMAVGDYHSCGLRTDGALQCWGYNSHGQASSPPGQFRAVAA